LRARYSPLSKLLTCLGFSLFLVLGFVCLLAGWELDTLYFRHSRAASLWSQEKPIHYRYTVEVQSSVWVTRYQVEILNDRVVSMIDLDTGSPAEFWLVAPTGYLQSNTSLWDFLIIDKLLGQIRLATRTPRSVKSFAARLEPGLYAQAVRSGWVDSNWLGCEIAYPAVRYNPDYGYPLDLFLPGNPCSWILEQKIPAHIQILAFQSLP